MRRRASILMGLAAALPLAAGLVLAGSPAHAHANLVSTDPASGSQLDEPPAEVRLRFSERVSVAPDGIALLDAGGEQIAIEPAVPAPEDPSIVIVPMPADLPEDSYVVSFRVVSADSHPVAGALVFGVGVPAGSLADVELPAQDPLVAAVFSAGRWTSYAGLALLAGGMSVLALCWPAGWSNPRARRIIVIGWAASLLGAVAVLLLQGPYGAGRAITGITEPALLSATLDTDYGRYVLARLALVLAAGGLIFLSPPDRWRTGLALALGVALPATWLGTGHANAAGNPLDSAADLAHLVAMSSWFGGLALLAICVVPRSQRLPAGEVGQLLRRFSLLATGAVVTLVVTGTYVAWRRVGSIDALLGTPYGRLLAFKIAAMGVLLWLGAMSRSVVQRRYALTLPGTDARNRSQRRAAKAAVEQELAARSQLRTSVRMEVGAAVAVLALASVLVATPPGVVVTAGEAIAAGPPPAPAPVADQVTFEEDDLIVQALVEPAQVGENTISIAVTDLAFAPLDPPEVRAALVLPEQDLGPLPVELTETGPGEYEAPDAQLPTTGDWRLEVTVRTTEIDSRTAQINVPVG
jgi:copper transport protein